MNSPLHAGRITVLAACLAASAPMVSFAAQDQTPAAGAAQSIDSLVRTIEAQQKLLEAQGRQIEELRREMAEIRALAKAPPPVTPATAAAPGAPAVAAVQTAEDQNPRVPELPPDVVSAGEFPGSIKLPGTDAALRIGGLVRVNWVSTFDPMLVDDRFVASAIPVTGPTDAGGGGRVAVIANPSRFNFDLRTPTGVGYMRAFIEGDFDGEGRTLRLRHAYGQWRRLVFGQTWSTFSDPEAEPDGIDFEGLNAIVLFRQPQVRWSTPLGERLRLAIAFEDPNPDLTGAAGVNQVPDFVGRVRWQPRIGGHVQVAGIGRQLRGLPEDQSQSDEIAGAGGYGANVSGRLPVPFGDKRDRLLFQSNRGRGIGRYISDLRTLGGQDGVYDPVTGDLHALDVYSGYVGYEHWWSQGLRSSFSFGLVDVSNLGIQPDEALHRTRRSSINFMWSPIPRLDLVTEFLWGRRENKDGRQRSATQTQIGSTFRF